MYVSDALELIRIWRRPNNARNNSATRAVGRGWMDKGRGGYCTSMFGENMSGVSQAVANCERKCNRTWFPSVSLCNTATCPEIQKNAQKTPRAHPVQQDHHQAGVPYPRHRCCRTPNGCIKIPRKKPIDAFLASFDHKMGERNPKCSAPFVFIQHNGVPVKRHMTRKTGSGSFFMTNKFSHLGSLGQVVVCTTAAMYLLQGTVGVPRLLFAEADWHTNCPTAYDRPHHTRE